MASEKRNQFGLSLRSMIPMLLMFLMALSGPPMRAQTSVSQPDLTKMTFVRQSFVRNFYSTGKVISQIQMEGTDLFLENAANLNVIGSGERPGMWQEGRRLILQNASFRPASSLIRVGSFHPYLCYEATFELKGGDRQEHGIEVMSNDLDSDGNPLERLQIVYSGTEVLARLTHEGKIEVLAQAGVGLLDRFSLRVQYTGLRFHVFLVRDNGEARLLFSSEHDMRKASTPVTHSWGIYSGFQAQGTVHLLEARAMLSSGTGQADPQVVQTRDGEPLIRDGRMYVLMTTRGFERIIDSYQGVYSIGLDGYDLRLEGALFFSKQDGILYGFHATKVVYDETQDAFLVLTTTHEDTHTLAWARTRSDLLHGMHLLECHELDFPHSYTKDRRFNTEDPDFFFDSEAGEWSLSYCAIRQGSYATYLCRAKDWNGPYRQIAESQEGNNTGIRQVRLGKRRYVLSGGSGTTFYIYDYPSLRTLGTFRQRYENGGFRGWPTIVPVAYGNFERYLWITFDRGQRTGKYSYGTLYFYLSDQMYQKEP